MYIYVFVYIYIYIYVCIYICFYRNQMHYNYKSDEKILKILNHKNILPTDPNKKYNLLYIIISLKPRI